MVEINKAQVLRVESEDRSGYYLFCKEGEEAFLPGTLAPKGLKPGDDIEVFVFVGSNGDVIATSQLPKVSVGEFACLRVTDTAHQGAYLDMGLPKELLVPNKLQKYEMNVGETHLVMVLEDEESQRLYGTTKISPYVETEIITLQHRQGVKIIPYHRTPLGFKVLVDKKYLGMIYHNEIFEKIEMGKEYEATVKDIRDDGHVDVLVGKTGFAGRKDSVAKLVEALENAGGALPLHDRSPPERIKTELGMSKKAFKAAIGMLLKQQKLRLGDGCIELIR